jgi:hypothetical protein
MVLAHHVSTVMRADRQLESFPVAQVPVLDGQPLIDADEIRRDRVGKTGYA